MKLGRDPHEISHKGLLVEPRQKGLVSRVHAQVACGDASHLWCLRDLGSSNGTVAKLARAGGAWREVSSHWCTLESGDLVAFGSIEEPPAGFPTLFQAKLPTDVGGHGQVSNGGA